MNNKLKKILYFVEETSETLEERLLAIRNDMKIRNITRFSGSVESYHIDKVIIASPDEYGVEEAYKKIGVKVENISYKPKKVIKDKMNNKEVAREARKSEKIKMAKKVEIESKKEVKPVKAKSPTTKKVKQVNSGLSSVQEFIKLNSEGNDA